MTLFSSFTYTVLCLMTIEEKPVVAKTRPNSYRVLPAFLRSLTGEASVPPASVVALAPLLSATDLLRNKRKEDTDPTKA